MNGQSEKVVLKDLQRHPSKPFILHFDLLRVSGADRIKMFIPFHFLGEDIAPGVKAGGLINRNLLGTEIICQAKDLPEYIEVDISHLEIGDVIHLSQVSIPERLEIAILSQGEDYDVSVVSIQAAKIEVADEEFSSILTVPDNEPLISWK